MNELSWLLYLVELSHRVAVLFTIIGVTLITVTIILSIMSFTFEDFNNSPEQDQAVRLRCRRSAIGFGITCCTLFFLATILPSQNTVYAIAAFEMGERVLDSKTGSLATQALNSWLQKQITSPDNK